MPSLLTTSSPTSILAYVHECPGQIAQLVEHRTENPGVVSSTLTLPIGPESMTVAIMNQVQAAMHSQPFRAFTVHLNDGRSYLIKHPDFISYSPHRTTAR